MIARYPVPVYAQIKGFQIFITPYSYSFAINIAQFMPEQQNIEYKRVWKDEYLKWVCNFANAQTHCLKGNIFITAGR
jgi:hypothetical protein